MPQEVSNDSRDVQRKTAFLKSRVHQTNPAIASSLIYRKRCMSKPQLRVTSMLQIILRTTESKYQEHPQAILCPLKIFGRVHRPQNIVVRHLLIKRSNQARNAVRTDHAVYLVFRQCVAVG